MIAAGGTRITEVAVMGNGNTLCTPCGGCRQKLREFAAAETKIHCCTEDGVLIRTFTLDELLPHSFGPENLS
jgi:cytidine deaminase